MGEETWRNELIAMRDRAERAELFIAYVRSWLNPDRQNRDWRTVQRFLDMYDGTEAATPAPGKEP